MLDLGTGARVTTAAKVKWISQRLIHQSTKDVTPQMLFSLLFFFFCFFVFLVERQ